MRWRWLARAVAVANLKRFFSYCFGVPVKATSRERFLTPIASSLRSLTHVRGFRGGNGDDFFQLRINANFRELFWGCGNEGTGNFSHEERKGTKIFLGALLRQRKTRGSVGQERESFFRLRTNAYRAKRHPAIKTNF